MKIEISNYYKAKGYNTAYLNTNKEPRRVITLRKPSGEMTSLSYAKYLYTSHYRVDIAEGDQVDHINGDKMDDRIENLQVISGTYNRQKDHKRKKWYYVLVQYVMKNFYSQKLIYLHILILVVVGDVVVLNLIGDDN